MRGSNAELEKEGLAARVVEVIDSKKRGLVARLEKTGEVDAERLGHVLGRFTRPWEWAGQGEEEGEEG